MAGYFDGGWKKVVLRTGILVVGLVAIFVGLDKLTFAHGDSVPYTLFRDAPGDVRKGDYVNVLVSHEIIGEEPRWLTKQVACVEGELLSYKNETFFCEGQKLGTTIPSTWDKKPLIPFVWNGPIPEGQVFLMTSHPRGFDSRYLGFIARSEVHRVEPIW